MNLFSFKKFTNWEYWPSYMFYIPNLPYAAYLAFKARNLVFFSATNPAIKHSGNGSESKFATIQLIPEEFKPKSVLLKANESFEKLTSSIKKNDINFPLIIKPDIGFRGLLVKRINSENELKDYWLKNNFIDLIVQEFVDYKNECGIFFHKLPNEKKGKITSITLKQYLSIIGDGKSTLLQLIQNDARAKNYVEVLAELHSSKFASIPTKNEEIVLNVIGNHSKGTQFINGNHLIDSELENAFTSFSNLIPNWYYGRLDIKYNDFDTLKKLKDFKIIEINGIISEPTHIYDSHKTSYFNALKEIRKHWKIIYNIATLNNSINNIQYDSVKDFLNSIKEIKKHTVLINKHS